MRGPHARPMTHLDPLQRALAAARKREEESDDMLPSDLYPTRALTNEEYKNWALSCGVIKGAYVGLGLTWGKR